MSRVNEEAKKAYGYKKKVQRMKDLKKLSLEQEVKREAEKIEKEAAQAEGLEAIKVSDEMEASLFNKIQEYEYDKRLKTTYRKKKKYRVIAALAAVLILVCGSVMTGVGSKSYWKVLWDEINGDEKSTGIDVEDMKSKDTDDIDEMSAYKELNKVFGDLVVRMIYKPKGMVLERYTIDEEQRKAYLFYNYKNELIRYTLYMNDDDSSFGQKDLDKFLDEYIIENGTIKINVKEYDVDNLEFNRYIAEYEYMDIHYQIMGAMEQEEFDEILKNLVFL